MTPEEAQRFVQHLLELRPQSAFAVRAALLALETPGVEADVHIKINKGVKDWPEITFSTG